MCAKCFGNTVYVTCIDKVIPIRIIFHDNYFELDLSIHICSKKVTNLIFFNAAPWNFGTTTRVVVWKPTEVTWTRSTAYSPTFRWLVEKYVSCYIFSNLCLILLAAHVQRTYALHQTGCRLRLPFSTGKKATILAKSWRVSTLSSHKFPMHACSLELECFKYLSCIFSGKPSGAWYSLIFARTWMHS